MVAWSLPEILFQNRHAPESFLLVGCLTPLGVDWLAGRP